MASAAATSRSAGRDGSAADRAAARAARAVDPVAGRIGDAGAAPLIGCPVIAPATLPVRVSKVLPPFLAEVASGIAPPSSTRSGSGRPAALLPAAPALQTFFCMRLGVLVAGLELGDDLRRNPAFRLLVSTNLIILTSAWRETLDQLADLLRRRIAVAGRLDQLPRFSASSRSAGKSFMQASDGPACVAGAADPLPAWRKRRAGRHRCRKRAAEEREPPARIAEAGGSAACDRCGRREALDLAQPAWPGSGAGNAVPAARDWPGSGGNRPATASAQANGA